LQVPEAEPRKMCLEPAIESHARLALLDGNLFYACHVVPTFVSSGPDSIRRAISRATKRKWPVCSWGAANVPSLQTTRYPLPPLSCHAVPRSFPPSSCQGLTVASCVFAEV